MWTTDCKMHKNTHTSFTDVKTNRGNCSYDDHNMAEVEIGKIIFC